MPSWRDAFWMALPPALVALAVTLLRLAGELRGWSEAWFSWVAFTVVTGMATGTLVAALGARREEERR